MRHLEKKYFQKKGKLSVSFRHIGRNKGCDSVPRFKYKDYRGNTFSWVF